MPDLPDLDTRIRQLVARAVADAPPPPDLEPAAVVVAELHPNRRRWWIGGSAAILAAAALVATFVLVGDSGDTVTTPATVPTTPVPATTSPAAPAPTSPAAPATTVPPATTVAPSTTSPPTTTSTTVPPGQGVARVVLTAGPAGVVERSGGGVRTLTTEPMVMALDAGDGRVIVQRRSGYGGDLWDDAATVPLVLGADGSLSELFGTSDWDGAVELHDIEIVAGRRLLLYSLHVASGNPELADETLYVVDLGTGERNEVAGGIGGWEFGTGRLHLATTGLIVGEAQSGPSTAIAIYAVPGSPATDAGLPTYADLGLEEVYPDCDCPGEFTVAPDGETIAWVTGSAGQLVGVSITALGAEAEPIADLPDGLYSDVDLDDAGALVSYFDTTFGEAAPPVPVFVPFDGSEPVSLDGVVATAGPAGSAVTPPAPGECGIDPQAEAITDHVDEVPEAIAGVSWVYTGDSNYDPCRELSYARLEVEGATGSSPMQLMLFHDGEYVGTASECAFALTTVTRTTADSVTVEYRWPRAGEPTADPTGIASVTYRWDGDSVQQDGELPAELLDVTGCG